MNLFKKSLVAVGLISSLGLIQVCDGVGINLIYGQLDNVDIYVIGDAHIENMFPTTSIPYLQCKTLQDALANYTKPSNSSIFMEAPNLQLNDFDQPTIMQTPQNIKDFITKDIETHQICDTCNAGIQHWYKNVQTKAPLTDMFLTKCKDISRVIMLDQGTPLIQYLLNIKKQIILNNFYLVYFLTKAYCHNDQTPQETLDSSLSYYKETLQALHRLEQLLPQSAASLHEEIQQQKLVFANVIKRLTNLKNIIEEKHIPSVYHAFLQSFDYDKAKTSGCFLCNLREQAQTSPFIKKLMKASEVMWQTREFGFLEIQALDHILQIHRTHKKHTITILAGDWHCQNLIQKLLPPFGFKPLFAVGDFFSEIPWRNKSEFLHIQQNDKLIQKFTKLVQYRFPFKNIENDFWDDIVTTIPEYRSWNKFAKAYPTIQTVTPSLETTKKRKFSDNQNDDDDISEKSK